MIEEKDTEPRRLGAPRHGKKAKITRSIAVDPDLWEEAILEAQRNRESLSGVIHDALLAYLAKGKAKE